VRTKKRNKLALIAGLFFVVSTLAFPAEVSPYSERTALSRGVGRIIGKVRIEGHFERPAPLKVYKNRDFCGAQVPNESRLVGPQRGLKNTVVILNGAPAEKIQSPLKSLFLDNENCAFVPHVQVAPVGSEILLLNSDPILHDVHARLGSDTLFNEGLPTWRQVRKQLTRAGIIRIECEVLHTWMSAYIVVTSSPYFAVTDAKGQFVIESVIPGSYEIEAWHEKLGRQAKQMTVTGGSMLRVEFVYRLGKRGT